MAKVNKLKTVQKAKPSKVDGLYTALSASDYQNTKPKKGNTYISEGIAEDKKYGGIPSAKKAKNIENANKSFSKQVSKQKTKKAVCVPDTMKAERKLNKKKKTASSSW